MKRLALFAVLAVVTATVVGCNAGSRTVSQWIHSEPDAVWAAVKKVVAAQESVTPASIDEETRTIVVKNAFSNIRSTRESSGRRNSVEAYNATITLKAPSGKVMPGSDELQRAGYSCITIKISQTKPTFSTADEDKPTALGGKRNSYGFTISNSSEIPDQFIEEVRKELEAMKAQETAQKTE